MVPKKDGKDRHVQDELTDTMALLDQEELVHAITKSTNASFFDLISMFDQTKIDPNDE
jgi:hypothetical protein